MTPILANRFQPLLKYPGGKEKELSQILPNLPHQIEHYYEPFVGGGAVYLAMDCSNYYINDKSKELISLYRLVKEQDEIFFEKLHQIEYHWTLLGRLVVHHHEEFIALYQAFKSNAIDNSQLNKFIHEFMQRNEQEFGELLESSFAITIENFVAELQKSIQNKLNRMKKIEEKKGELNQRDIIDNIEGAFKSAFYTHFRFLYNNIHELEIPSGYATAIFLFMRQYCYSSMFRFNKKGDFNVPYGGISYNKLTLTKKIQSYQQTSLVKHLANTVIGNEDFHDFMKQYPPESNDFVFLDPPYDTPFSTYDQNDFGRADQIRLAKYLIEDCNANFMLVIKNTAFIAGLYEPGTRTCNGQELHVLCFDKQYGVSFQDRNNKEAQHLLIRNYNNKK